MQGFDEQEGNIATLLEISQQIETMEEWSETKKAATGKRDRSVSKKSDKSSSKQKGQYFCEYHGSNQSHGTKDCIRASLSYNPLVSLVTRNTVWTRRPLALTLTLNPLVGTLVLRNPEKRTVKGQKHAGYV